MHTIIAIAAMAKSRAIGKSGRIPWHIKDDMEFFKTQTTGHPCIMASGTWQSLPNSFKPLPNRTNIVVSSKKNLQLPEGVLKASSFEEAALLAKSCEGSEKIFICGGVSAYQWAIQNADELLISEIPMEVSEADKFFPEFSYSLWQEINRASSPNQQCEFVSYKRRL